MSLDECAKLLSDFGLTFNQAKAYIAVVQLGLASVSQVSRISKVRREDIYRMLPKLEKLGLIEKILGKPIKIRATPLEDALSILIKREEDSAKKRLSMLRTEKDALLIKSNLHKTTPKLKEPNFTLVSQREAVIYRGLTMIEAAEKAIDIITSRDQFLHFFTNYTEPVKKAMKKGVKFRVVLDTAEHDESILRIMKQYESSTSSFYLNYTHQSLSHYAVVDYREALMATSVEPTALGRNPYLWTNDGNLIELMTRNFESIWHTSVRMNPIETEDEPKRLIRLLTSLKPTNHIMFLYRATETKHSILSNYIKAGLANHEAVIYITSEETPSQARDTLKQFGIEVEKNEKAGALHIIGYDEFYIQEEKFSIPITIGFIRKMYDEALKHGFKGCRAFGEMACFFKHNLVQELIEYEEELHRVLDIPIIALCAYNTNILGKAGNPVELYNELLRAHSTVLLTGRDNKLGRIDVRQV
jgi:sugar-specific transcriptional regulator TrmB